MSKVRKPIFNTKFSVFKSLFDSQQSFEINLTDLFRRIKEGNEPLIKKIEKIRSEETTKEEKDSIKKSLVSVTFCGTFTKRAKDSLIEHSGVCCMDFDKYPNEETLKEEREKIENDPYTLACFRSPSGNGLKVLIRIPKSTASEHERRFRAYEKYINSEYFDEACKDISRVCFESYDPNLFTNQLCEEFTEIAPEEGYKVATLSAFDIPLTDDTKACEYIVKNWEWSTDFNEGQRNNHIYKLAAMCCNYGVPEEIAFQYIMNNVINDSSFAERECQHTVNSAYKRTPFGVETFRDYDKENEIKRSIKKGETPQKIAQKTKVSEKQIKEIKEIVQNNFETFWEIIKVQEGEEEREKVVFEPFKVKGFYIENGFYKYLPNEKSDSVYLRIKNNKVEIVSRDYIHSFMTDFVDPNKSDKGSQLVFNEFFKNAKKISSEDALNTLLDNIEDFDNKILKDTKTECYRLYKNTIVKVTKNKIEEINYLDINKYVWKARIKQRDYVKTNSLENDFKDFISKVSNKEPARIESLETTIGYLISNYKDKKHQKAVILNDEEINDNPNGGSGKSLFYNALKHFKEGVQIDGKLFNHNKSFIYSGINHETELMCFDDVKKNFNFEALFSLITEGIEVEQKGKDKFFIPFEDSPKVVITTNYVIKGAGGSHQRRRHEVEFFQYFNSNHSPLDEYGKQLFNEWTSEEWANFDNYMLSNVQKFLSNGLVQVKSINANVKRFIQETHEDFYEWVSDDDNIWTNCKCYNNDKLRDFTNEFKGWEKTMTSKKFMKFISEYANFKGYNLEKKRDSKGRYFILNTEKNEVSEDTTSSEFEGEPLETPF
jgi:uncharacterized protein YaaR (DUF327 family)